MTWEMKDSGIEWIGEIPNDWEIRRGKRVFTQRHEKGNIIQLQLLSPTQKYGVIPQGKYEQLSGMKAVKLNEGIDLGLMKTIHRGDFCISLRSFQGGFEYSDYEGVVSPAYQVFYPTNEIVDEYYKFLFKATTFIEKVNSYTLTLRDGKKIAFSDFGNTMIPYPQLSTQHRIANYLDTKCSEIDVMVEKTKATIEEYKKLKQSIITEAVTKGLDKTVPMKDSGVEWIGAIPEHWDCVRFGRIASVKSNLVPPDEYYDYPQIAPDNIEKDTGKMLSYQTVRDSGIISDNHLFSQGQILYSKIRPKLNKVMIAPFSGLCSADMYPIETDEVTKYILYTMLSVPFMGQVASITESRVKMPKINQMELNGIIVVRPPMDEQKEIADYLDQKCQEIDTLIEKKQTIVTELERYKKSLIYECVTGKREV